MLAIEVNFLTGRFVATAHNDREASEWPPHPARLFSALVATWAEAGEDSDERRVLEELEALSPPKLVASEATARKVVSYYVPVNDANIISGAWYMRQSSRLTRLENQLSIEIARSESNTNKKIDQFRSRIKEGLNVTGKVTDPGKTPVQSALNLMPDGRVRQERHFPSVTPDEPRVTFVWPEADFSEATMASFDDILKRVTRLGHSSSLVSCRIVADPPTPNWHPGSGNYLLRCISSGQLAVLGERFSHHQAIKPRSLPFSSVRYHQVSEASESSPPLVPDTVGEWVIFEFLLQSRSRRFPSTRAVEIASTMRAAIMSYAGDPILEGLSGHQADGKPTLKPHVAFLPLPYVGFEHADGRIMGLAVSLPGSLDTATRRATLRAIGLWERQVARQGESGCLNLVLGREGVIQLRRRNGPIDLVTIRRKLWQRASVRWATATPVALPTHPGPLTKGSPAARSKAWMRAEQAVAASCSHVGLPEPVQVDLSLAPFIKGARPAAHFPPFRQRGRNGKPVARRLLHAMMTFDRPIQGPLALGAGRFLGLGLMRPIDSPKSVENEVDES